MEKQPDRDAIAEEAVGQRHEHAPPYAVKKAEVSQEEVARRLAIPPGNQASTSEKSAESVGERVGDAYSDPESVARGRSGVSNRVRSMPAAGFGISNWASEQWFTAMVAGFALGYLTAALVHRRR